MVAEGPVALASLGESRTCDSCRWLPGSQGRRAGRADGPAGKEGSSVTGQALPTHCRRQTGQPVPRGPSPASWRYPLPRQLRGSLDTPGPRPQRSPAAALCPPATSGPQRTNLRGCEGVRPDRGPETCLQHTCSPLAAPTAQRPGGLRPQPKEGSLFRMQGPPNAPSLRQRGAHTPPQKSRGTGLRAGAGLPPRGNSRPPGPAAGLLSSIQGQPDGRASTSVPLPRWGTGPAGTARTGARLGWAPHRDAETPAGGLRSGGLPQTPRLPA